jgi:hypothetical protein
MPGPICFKGGPDSCIHPVSLPWLWKRVTPWFQQYVIGPERTAALRKAPVSRSRRCSGRRQHPRFPPRPPSMPGIRCSNRNLYDAVGQNSAVPIVRQARNLAPAPRKVSLRSIQELTG